MWPSAPGSSPAFFGFGSGLAAYARRRLIDYRLGVSLLVVTIPAALVGTWVAGLVAADILKTILGVGLFGVAASFLRAPEPRQVGQQDAAIEDEYGGEKAETCLVTQDGERICYTVCNRTEGRALAGIGALFMGMISTGLGELNGYFLLRRCWVPSRVAVATSVFVVAVTALAASTGHFIPFAQAGGETFEHRAEPGDVHCSGRHHRRAAWSAGLKPHLAAHVGAQPGRPVHTWSPP